MIEQNFYPVLEQNIPKKNPPRAQSYPDIEQDCASCTIDGPRPVLQGLKVLELTLKASRLHLA